MNVKNIISNPTTEFNDQSKSNSTFLRFIFHENIKGKFLWIALGGSLIQFIIFKHLYPFADFFSDSYSYIFAAQANLDISIWPIGYSKFLRIFHTITYSDTALVGFQYFLIQLSILYFFFTTLFFYSLSMRYRIVLFLFLFFNPLFLYISNYVNSDPLFIALSLMWFTELLWIIHLPSRWHIIIQALVLFAAFAVRNNAYYYPFITAIAFALSGLYLWEKILGTALGLILIIPFIMHTRTVAYYMTGTKQFSLFTGWQLANNALYMYPYVNNPKLLSQESKELEELANKFYSNTPKYFRRDYLLPNQGNFFIQHPLSPLKQYLSKHYKIDDQYSSVVAWGRASAIFEKYGLELIIQNKMEYIRQFILPNINNYFLPHLEKMQLYNLGQSEVASIAVDWFHYKNNKVTVVSSKAQESVLIFFPFLFLTINIYLILGALWLLVTKHLALIDRSLKYALIVSGSFLFLNCCFCISATIIVLRYQIFPMIICFYISLMLMETIDQKKTNRFS